ncbi:MAG: ABC transporter ATP-binding protein [Desulforhabdus sp.]|nr:ABC transporter ATP-binding protein [Desulforhabdus sp.]
MQQFQEFFFTQFQQEVTIDIQEKVLERTISLPKTFFDSVKSGYLVSRLRNDVQWIQWFFSGTLVQFAAQLCKFVGSVAFLFYLEWRIALPVILTVPITWLIASYLSAKTYILSHHAMESHAEVSGNFQECFSNVPLIKGFTREIDTIGKLIQGLRQIHSIGLEQQSLNGLIQLSINAVPGFAKLLVMGFGSYLVVKDTWTLGSLLAFIAYLDYVYAPAKFLASSQHQFQRSRAALQRVVSLLHMIPEVNIDSGEIMARPVKRVEFRGVVFSYNRQKIVLDGVSFSANAGQKVTILGPSGSGKTTFISLLLRFYQPTEGEILFNGRPARELETRSIRASFGYVPQENLLFSGTIIENLIYGNSAATHEQVERAARTAGIQDFIVSLRDGYQTKVGERGVTLSEGQKQRLSIARALVPDPDILILDEPTSALDLPTAHEILTSLSRSAANKILFIVTHRPDAMEESDLLIELDAGGRVKVRESGKIV